MGKHFVAVDGMMTTYGRSSIKAILTKVIATKQLPVDVEKAVERTLQLIQVSSNDPVDVVDAMAKAIKEQQ